MGLEHVLFTLFGVLLAAATLVLGGLFFGEGSVSRFAAAGLTVATATIVALAQLTSLIGEFNAPGMLFGQAMAVIAMAVTAKRLGHTQKIGLLARRCYHDTRAFPIEARRHPSTAAMVLLAGVCAFLELYLAVRIAPNTWDSMTYHLTRSAYWIQNETIAPFDNATVRQAAFPVNGEVLQAWTMMLSRGDRLVQTIQWVIQFGFASIVFAAARDLRFERSQALAAACLALSIPIVVAQATSSQNDLLVTFYGTCGTYFLWRGARESNRSATAVGAVALGMAVGTKTVGLLFIPIAAIAVVSAEGRRLRETVTAAALCLVAVAAFGSFAYVGNVLRGDSFTGPDALDKYQVGGVRDIPENAARLGWRSVASMPDIDLPPFEELARRVFEPLVGFARTNEEIGFTFDLAFDHRTNENLVGLGLPALLILGALIYAVTVRRTRPTLLWATMSLAMFLAVVATVRYNVWTVRFALLPAALALPVTAVIARREAGRMLILVVIIVSMVPMTVHAWNKPLILIEDETFVQGRVAEMTRENPAEGSAINTVEAQVPPTARLGFIGVEDSWEYPYFGPHLERTLVKLTVDDLTPRVLKEQDLDALIVSGPVERIPNRLKPVPVANGISLVMPESPHPR